MAVVTFAMAMVAAASASSVTTHYLSSNFGQHELSIEERSGVAYDAATEDVYVADTGHDRIARYGATGEPLGSLAALTEPTYLAVDDSSGDIYAVEEGNETIVKLDSSGVPISSWGTAGQMTGFGEIIGIAVDPSGNLFIVGADYVMHELGPAGGQSNQCSLPYPIVDSNGDMVEQKLVPRGIAVNSEDDVYFPHEYPLYQARTSIIRGMGEMTSACDGITDQFDSGWDWNSAAVDDADESVFLASGHEAGTNPGDDVGHASAEGERIGRVFGGLSEDIEDAGQLAVRSEDEAVYLVNVGADDISVFTVGTVEPPQVTILSPTDVKGTSARLRATIDPDAPAGNPPAWAVEYDFECVDVNTGKADYHCGRVDGEVPTGSEPVEVEGTVTELQPASEYEVSVDAYSVAGASARSPEEPEVGLPFQTGAIAPGIEEEAIAATTESSVSVAGLINPHGAETGYWVEYVTKSQFEAKEFSGAQKTAEQSLPATITGESVSVTLAGLTALTSYAMRMVATNTIEGSVETVFGESLDFATAGPSLLPVSGSCPGNEAFRTFAGSFLPDCRAYEQASPVDKNGGSVEAVPGSIQDAGEAGDAITFFSEAGIPGGLGAQDYPTFLSTRSGESWTTQGLLPAQSLGEFGGYLGLTPDGKYAITEATRTNDGTGVFARNLETGEVTTVVPYDSGCGSGSHCFTFAGASADGSMIFLESELDLNQEPSTTEGPPNLYVWNRETGAISLVDVAENGAGLPEGGFAGAYNWPDEDPRSGGTLEGFYVSALHAISQDGTEAVYTERGEQGHAQLYVRLELGGNSPRSVKISAYAAGRSGSELPAAFLEATPDGRYVFFKSEAELSSDSYAGEGSDSLYRYDVSTGTLTDLTSKKFQAGPGVVGMLGASDSGQVAYFVSTTLLTTTPGPGGATAEAGRANLYRWQEGASPAITFVAALDDGSLESVGVGDSDSRDWSPFNTYPGNEGTVTAKTARVSADGGVVVFSSRRSLTGMPNLSRGCDGEQRIAPCAEFFRYAAASKTLACVSCSPAGIQPVNGASIGTEYINAADLPLRLAAPVLTRNLSANGNRFFFQTPDSLSPADKDGPGCTATADEEETCLDVYEWEAQGEGSCTSATEDGGCLYLISGGDVDEPSYFADADREGKNVFFFTSAQLVPSDRDHLYDVYDAREDGGLASQNQSPAVPCGSRQECQGPSAGSGAAASPGTSGFAGPGNQKPSAGEAPPVCKKGYVRRKDKCVKKARKKHKKKKHKKKKHHKKRGGGSNKTRTGHDAGGKK
jgi:hypothetical protein